MSAEKDAIEAQLVQWAQQDPQIQAIVAKFRADPGPQGHGVREQQAQASRDINARLDQMAQQMGLPAGQYKLGFKVGSDGTYKTATLTADHQNWFERHPALTNGMIAGGMVAAPFIAGAAAGGSAAGATGGVSAGMGAAGTPAELAAMGGPGAMAAGAAPSAAGITTGASTAGALGGWGKWLNIAANAAPVVGSVIGAANNRNALATAKAEQERATAQAVAAQNRSIQNSGNVYQQQRADFQNLFGSPYATLGAMMGMNVGPTGPMPGVATTEAPTGYNGFREGPLRTPLPGDPMGSGAPPRAPQGMTLADLQRYGGR